MVIVKLPKIGLRIIKSAVGVFLSIVVNHISDSNPYLFVWNRFLDIMIGDVVYFMLIDDKEKMQRIYDALMKEDFARELKVLFYDSTDYAGKAFITLLEN